MGSGFSGIYGQYFTVDTRGHMVPAHDGVVDSYGAAWTPPSLVVFSFVILGASLTSYTVTMVPNAAHVREMASTPGGVNQDVFVGVSHAYQLAQACQPAMIALGTTIWCRDGQFNPTGALAYFEPAAKASYSGTGRITIRSETVDTLADTDGYKYRRHGFKIGKLYLYHSAAQGSELPFEFVDIAFYSGINAVSPMVCATAAQYKNVGWDNCSFELGTDISLDTIGAADVRALTGVMTDSRVTNCTFRRVGGGIAGAGPNVGSETTLGPSQNLTITGNVFITIRDDDCILIGGNSFGHIITDNTAFDVIPTAAGGHCDFIQWAYLNTQQGPLGTIARNIGIDSTMQGLFIADTYSNGGKFTSGTIEHNVMCGSAGNEAIIYACDDVVIRWNNFINRAGAGNGVCSIGAGNNATMTRNVSNGFGYSIDNPTGTPHAQTGTITKSPNPQVVITPPSTASYQAVWPGYADPSPNHSFAALKAMFTPDVAGYAALSSSGVWDASGNYNATP